MTDEMEVLTADEAAHLLKVSTKTVVAFARDGSLPAENVGRAWQFLWSDLLGYVHGDSGSQYMESVRREE
jgi:excisionase family DNA binding protein